MEIALIADDNKKELMAQFCIAYQGILCRHHLCATHITGKYISDATGLEIETFLAGSSGGTEQIASKISYNEIDLVFYFRDNLFFVLSSKSLPNKIYPPRLYFETVSTGFESGHLA